MSEVSRTRHAALLPVTASDVADAVLVGVRLAIFTAFLTGIAVASGLTSWVSARVAEATADDTLPSPSGGIPLVIALPVAYALTFVAVRLGAVATYCRSGWLPGLLRLTHSLMVYVPVGAVAVIVAGVLVTVVLARGG